MKKTIILMMTAASTLAATAATLADSKALDLGTTIYTNADAMWTDTDFTVMMTLDIVKLKADLKNSGSSHVNYNLCMFSLRTDSDSSAYEIGTQIVYTASTATTSSVWTRNDGLSRHNLAGNDNFLSDYVDDEWAHADGATLTMGHIAGSAGTYTLLSIHLADGSFLEYEDNDTGWRWTSGDGAEKGVSSINIGTGDNTTNPVMQAYLFNTKLSTSDIKAINTKLIPEPATATLSLLALAGLAARRRRK